MWCFYFLAGERVGFPHKVSETGVELFRLVQEHQVAALVELVGLTVALHLGSKAVYHVQTVGFGLCAEYGVRNGDLFQIAEIIGQAEVVVQFQRRPGHRLFALGLEPGPNLIVHSLRTGNAGDEFVVEELGVVVKRQVGVEPVLQVVVTAAVVVPVGVRERIQRAVHRHEAVELVLLKFGCIADNDGGGQRPAQQDDMLQTEMVDEFLDVLCVAADGVALTGLGGVALSAEVHCDDAELFGEDLSRFFENLVVHKNPGTITIGSPEPRSSK